MEKIYVPEDNTYNLCYVKIRYKPSKTGRQSAS